MKKRTRVLCRVGVFLALFVFASCGGGGDSNSEPDAIESLALGNGKVYGQVIDAATRGGIAGAGVVLYLDNTTNLTATSDAQGNFEILGAPGGEHRLLVTKEGYAAYEEWLTFIDSSSYVAAGAEGRVALALACNATVIVTNRGAIVTGATVYASPEFGPELTAVTDTTGSATLNGLSQAQLYTFVVPAFDANRDGSYDYNTASISYHCLTDVSPASIALNEALPDDSLRIVGGSRPGSIAAGGNVVLVFNYPVIPEDQFAYSLAYYDDLVSGAQMKDLAQSITAAWSTANTVLTITPSSPLVENETYTLRGTFRTTIGGRPSVAELSDLGYNSWYVYRTAPITLAEVSADNYNGRVDHSGAASQVYLKFPERVYGSAIIIGYTADGVASASSTGEVGLGSGVFRRAGDPNGCVVGACGTDGIVYAVPLTGLSLRDHTAISSQQNGVTVYIDAYDADGNVISGAVTLPTP